MEPDKIKNFLKIYRNKNPIVNDAYDRLMAKIYLDKTTGNSNTFAFLGCGPKVGTTSIAINSAVSLSNSNWKTLLIDADFRKGSDEKRLNVDIPKGLSDYLLSEMSIADVLCETSILNLSYISCGMQTKNPVQLLCMEKFKTFIAEIKQIFDFIFFDASSVNTSVDAILIAKAVENVVLILKQNETQKPEYESALSELQKIGANLFGVVLNEIDKDEYKRHLKNYNYYARRRRK